MRASGESGSNGLLQCSQVGRSSSMSGLLRQGVVACLFYVFKSGGSMGEKRGEFACEREEAQTEGVAAAGG